MITKTMFWAALGVAAVATNTAHAMEVRNEKIEGRIAGVYTGLWFDGDVVLTREEAISGVAISSLIAAKATFAGAAGGPVGFIGGLALAAQLADINKRCMDNLGSYGVMVHVRFTIASLVGTLEPTSFTRLDTAPQPSAPAAPAPAPAPERHHYQAGADKR